MEVESLVDIARKQIRELIITGEFKPGQQLKEDELCKRFGISRPPIREAFKTLESDGMVFRRPRYGVFVCEITAKDVWEIYSIVSILYQMGTVLALASMTNEDIRRIQTFVDDMERHATSDPVDLRSYQMSHLSFHEAILEKAGNRRLQRMGKNLRFPIARISYKSLHVPEHLESSLTYHKQIMEALEKRDRERSVYLMNEHVMKALELLLKIIAENEKEAPLPPDVQFKNLLLNEQRIIDLDR